MPIVRKNVKLTVEEYLEGERCSDIRHEYERGEVVARVGASRKHNRLTLDGAFSLRMHLLAGYALRGVRG